jgi:hypothetical protein
VTVVLGSQVKKTAKVRERRVEINARGGEVTKKKMKESAEVMKLMKFEEGRRGSKTKQREAMVVRLSSGQVMK